ncbi:MAG: 5-bromo-4-chloroindolyl phosphate hydrolysis family protein [Mobilitalea sp.]
MDNRNNFNLGDEIKNIVQDAVNNRDFNRLNRDIGNLVNGALGEVRNSIDRNRGNNTSWKPNDYKPENEKDQQTWNGQKQNQQSSNPNDKNNSNSSNGYNRNSNTNNSNTNNNTYTNNKNSNTYSNNSNAYNNNSNAYNNNSNAYNSNTYNNNNNAYNSNSNTYSNNNNNANSNNNAYRNNNTYSNSNRKNNTYSNANNNAYNSNNRNANGNVYSRAYTQTNQVSKPAVFTVPIGQVSGTLLTVFGTIGSILFTIAAVVLALLGYLLGQGGIFYAITLGMLPCIMAFAIMHMNGNRIRNRLKRFKSYLSQLHGRNYCLIKDFSSITGLSMRYTVKDLQRMISIGMFPEGHIDDKKTCFMLNSESYELYLKLQENMQMKDIEEHAKQKEQTGEDTTQKDILKPEIRKSIEEGREYVQKIRTANSAIPGEEISRKLDRLEEVTGKIFDYVEVHPGKISEIKKFTEYFLPTTLKLLDAYREFDFQPVEGENIATAKKEIEETLDTINLAFENLLDGLFEDAAMDISTDISVMETMFAQEGLTQKNVRS